MSSAQKANVDLFSSSDVYSTNHLLRTNHKAVSIYLSRIYFSKYCRAFYIVLIALSLVLVLWTLAELGRFPEESAFEALEIFVSSMIVGEVTGRVVMQGFEKFCRSWLNVFDVLVASLSIIVIVDVLNSLTLAADLEGLVSEIWLTLRTVLQFLRLIVFVKNQKKAQVMVLQVINFSELAQPSARSGEVQMVEGSKLHLTEEFDEKDGLFRQKSLEKSMQEETKSVS